MSKKRSLFLHWGLLVLLIIGLTLAGCDSEDTVEIAPEIRLHFLKGHHCETVRIFFPGIHSVETVTFGKLSSLLKKKGIILAFSGGVFRVQGRYGELSWQRFDVLTNRWVPVATTSAMRDAWQAVDYLITADVNDRTSNEISYTDDYDYYARYLARKRGIEVWQRECLPTPTPMVTGMPSPSPTPTLPLMGVAVTWTPTLGPTPTLTPSAGTREVTFFTSPQENLPCTQVRFRFQTDAQGRPDLSQPFLISYHGLTYRISFSKERLAALDEAFPKVSPTQFRNLLALAKVEIPSAEGKFQEWFSPLPVDSPIVRLLYLLWGHRALSTADRPWWVARQGNVHWRDPLCNPKPTATPGQYAKIPTATPPFTALPTATFTPLPPGMPSPTPGPTNTPNPTATLGPTSTFTPLPPPTATPAPVCDQAQDVTAQALPYINQIRQEHGVPPVGAGRSELRKAVKEVACLMNRYHVLSHSPGGVTVPDRLWRYGLGYHFYVENVAIDSSLEKAINGWKESPGHLANMINDRVTECAVAVAGGAYYAMGCINP